MIDLSSQTINGQSAWAALILQNNWVPYGSGYQFPFYCIDFLGNVQVRGLASATSSGGGGPAIAMPTVVSTLPVGFRPQRTENFLVDAYDGTHELPAKMQILIDGTMTVQLPTGSPLTTLLFVWLTGIRFSVFT